MILYFPRSHMMLKLIATSFHANLAPSYEVFVNFQKFSSTDGPDLGFNIVFLVLLSCVGYSYTLYSLGFPINKNHTALNLGYVQ